MSTSGAAAAIAPEPQDGPGPVATADDEVITWAEFRSWERQLSRTGACSRPIRLRGVSAIDTASGEVAGGVLHVACGNRRETMCPSCSALYKGDARQLVRAGLTGGKGVPESVSAHPCVFATLTAPSFGPVHARRMRGKTVLPCRPRRDSKDRRCPHGRDISCPVRHVDEDPRLGRPLCGDCYDYEAAVLVQLPRGHAVQAVHHLPAPAPGPARRGHPQAAARRPAHPLRQGRRIPGPRRHPLPRRDPPRRPRHRLPLPPPRYTTAVLCDAITLAARAVRIDAPTGPGRPRVRLGFGPQTEADPIWRQPVVASGQPLDVDAVANYIAKYATKSTDVPGLPDARIRNAAAIGALRCSAHHKRMIATAWQLGSAQATGDARLRQWAHTLGYGGHFLTKSRRYSVTFGQLRRARAEHRRLERYGDDDGVRDPWGRPLDDTIVLVVNDWTYAGRGYAPRTPGAQLALASADRARGR